ncbi:MAG: hypothetical protein AB7T59_14165 [Hyphomonadaceae bacterium]
MRLKRFLDQVRTQNWIAVTIEFVIVVAGVFLGMQANTWQQMRAERVLERAYYVSLANDLRADVAEYQFSIRMATRSIEAANAVRAVILGNPDASGRPLSQSLFFASWVNYPNLATGTVDELYAAGTIRVIRDAEVKNALHTYQSEAEEWRSRLQSPEYGAFLAYRLRADPLLPMETRNAYLLTRLDDENVERQSVDETGLARRLRGDAVLLDATERMISDWVFLSSTYERQLEEARALLALVERHGRG